MSLLQKFFKPKSQRDFQRNSPLLEEVNLRFREFDGFTSEQFRGKTDELRARVADGESLDSVLPEAFGLVKAACKALVGTSWNVCEIPTRWEMVPYEVWTASKTPQFGFMSPRNLYNMSLGHGLPTDKRRIEECRKVAPDDRFVRMGLANIALHYNRPDEAEQHYQFVIDNHPELLEAKVRLGQVYVQSQAWQKLGHDVGLGIGIAQGEATLGVIGFEQRWEYAAIGNVPNLAARLCGEARAGEILLDAQVEQEIAALAYTEPVGPLQLRGFFQPVPAFRLRGMK